MRAFLASIATWMSRFRYVLVISATVSCVHTLSKSQATPPDLSGSIACGTTTCGSGEICVDFEADGSDGSAHPISEYSCATPPPSCPLFSCNGQCEGNNPDCCPQCITDICGPITSYDGERSLTCYGF